jgi:hypothetical protein
MNIYIMTRGRVGRQHTWNALPNRIREKTYIVCPHEERNLHPGNVLISPEWVKNYSDKFKYLVELEDGGDRAVIIDDDLKFSVPYINPETGRRLQTVSDQGIQIAVGFDYMEHLLEDTALVSFHPRQMGHTKEPPYVENGKIVCVQGINRRLVGSIPDLNRFPILADVVLNATLLERGVSNKIITTLFVDWYPCQAPGGCSETRTAEIQAEACYWLEERFGPYIKAVEKDGNWLGGKRVDFRGQWKKLYAAGVAGVLDIGERSCTPVKRTR